MKYFSSFNGDVNIDSSGCSNAVAFVSTPLHVIYTIEFVTKYKVSKVSLVILIKRETDKYQLYKAIEYFNWESVEEFNQVGGVKSRIPTVYEAFLSRYFSKKEKYTYGIYSDYGAPIIANLNVEMPVWLGDGTKILFETENLKHGATTRELRAKIVERVFKAFFRLKLTLDKPRLIFTPFDIRSNQVVRHDFPWLRSMYKSVPENANFERSVFFFGAYYTEVSGREIISAGEYLDLVRRVVRYFCNNGKTVIYIPHRHESESKLETIGQIKGINIEKTSVPAELYFLETGIPRMHVASFTSTCLFNFSYLGIANSITCFYVDFSKYGTNRADELEVFYKHLRLTLKPESFVDVGSI